MKQVDRSMYQVEPGEVVTIVWTAVQVIDSAIAMAVDTFGLVPNPEHPPTFTFNVTKAVGQRHFAAAEGSFPTDTAPDARFDSELHGSKGGRFAGPSIFHSDAPLLRRKGINFAVVASTDEDDR